jgi:predicted transcriptional regulator
MGFHKRYVSKESLKIVYREKGEEGLENYLYKPDALIIDRECEINLKCMKEIIQKIQKWISEEEKETELVEQKNAQAI